MEELIDEIALVTRIALDQIRNEHLGKGPLFVQNVQHFLLRDSQQHTIRESGSCRRTHPLAGKAVFSQKITIREQSKCRLLSIARNDRDADPALLDVEDFMSGIALLINPMSLRYVDNRSSGAASGKVLHR